MNAATHSLDDLLWFLRVAQAGSLTRASVELAVPKSTLSKRLTRLEAALGVALVHRSSRAFRLTDAGSRLAQQSWPSMQQLEAVTAQLASESLPAKGLVRLSASGSFGKLVLMPVLARYLLAHPQVRIEAELTDRRVNLIKEGFDFAVRIGDLPDSDLRARRAGSVRRVLCAAPSYAAAQGLPNSPDELAAHAALIQAKTSASVTLERGSQRTAVFLSARLVAGPSDCLLEPVLMGVGIAAMPEIQVAALLRSGQLVRVLPEWEMPAFEVQILYPAQQRLAGATRSVIDWLAEQVPAKIEDLLRA